jgi:hypothetical protein
MCQHLTYAPRDGCGSRDLCLIDISASLIAAASVKPSYLVQPQLRQSLLHAFGQRRIRRKSKMFAQMLADDGEPSLGKAVHGSNLQLDVC